MAITILLADDHKIFREGLKNLLEREEDISVIADTDHGAGAVELSWSLKPDIAILDMETYRLNLMKKLKITSVVSLVKYAIREGIIVLA